MYALLLACLCCSVQEAVERAKAEAAKEAAEEGGEEAAEGEGVRTAATAAGWLAAECGAAVSGGAVMRRRCQPASTPFVCTDPRVQARRAALKRARRSRRSRRRCQPSRSSRCGSNASVHAAAYLLYLIAMSATGSPYLCAWECRAQTDTLSHLPARLPPPGAGGGRPLQGLQAPR